MTYDKYNNILEKNIKKGKEKLEIQNTYFQLIPLLKEDYGEKSVVLMQVGSFYESYADENNYLDDLIKLGETLNFGVANKQDYKMVGFPVHSKDKNIDKLLSENYTIMIVDQHDYMSRKKRLVTEVLNNSTNIYSNKLNSYIIGIFFDKYKDNYTVGLTSIDIMTNKLYVYETGNKDMKIILDETYHFVSSFDCSEIIIFNNLLNEEDIINRLNIKNINTKFEKSNKEYENINIQKKYLNTKFNNNTELDILQYLEINMNEMIINSLIYTLNYIEKYNISLIKNCNIPEIWNNHNFLNIVNDGFYQLDIISNNNKSLIDILDYTSTNMGNRFLKNSILIPICDEKELNKKYDNIELLINNNNYKYYENELKDISDLEKLHRKITLKKINTYELYNVYVSYKRIIELYQLTKKDNIYLYLNDNDISNISNIINRINDIYDIETLSYSNINNIKESFFKKGFNNELDELEIKMNELDTFLHKDLKNKIDNIFGMDNCQIKLNDKETYINITSLRKFSENKLKSFELNNYIFHKNNFKIKKNKTNIKISHLVLDNIRAKYDQYKDNFINKIKDVFENYIIDFNNKYDYLYNKIVKFVGELDFYKSCSKCSILHNYNKPIIDYSLEGRSYIDCKQIRHPIIERINTNIEYVPNDISIGKEDNGFLLYGVNSIGKSSLMKSIGLTITMAQASMYVPCSYMKFNPFENIFTRINNNDDLYNGLSSFGVEISELRTIFKKSNHKSIIIGDEICSGTETISAIGIVYATLKELLNLNSVFVFATHLHELNDILDLNNIRKYHLSISYNNGVLEKNRTLREGCGKSFYGIEIAKSLGLQDNVINYATSLIDKKKSLIDNYKVSHYNSKKILDKCEICLDKDALETHHIKEQYTADDNGMVGNIHKNNKSNLAGLCIECHRKVTNNQIIVEGYVETSKGVILKYRDNNNIKSNKKFKENEIEIIRSLLQKDIPYKNCITLLKDKYEIDISSNTLRKIKNNEY